MLYLSQRDARWAGKRIGASRLTVGSQGCALTGVSMLSSYYGCYLDPGQLAEHKEAFTPAGLIVWQNIPFHGFRFVRREYFENDVSIKASIVPPQKAVLIRVPLHRASHWLVAIEQVKTRFGFDYLCVNPWTGQKCFAKATYGRIDGSAHFERV